jgi:hypothetical protein
MFTVCNVSFFCSFVCSGSFVLLFCVMCIIRMLCPIVVSLPQGKTPSTNKLNNNIVIMAHVPV